VGRATALPAPSFSGFLAWLNALSAVIVMNAFSFGFNRCMRSRQTVVSSTGEMSFRRTRCEASRRAKIRHVGDFR
jgi:hypothetical protein